MHRGRMRRELHVQTDDWRKVWTEYKAWARLIYQAMILITPEAEADDWMSEQHKRLFEKYANQEDYEAAAMVLVHGIIDMHANGVRLEDRFDLAKHGATDNNITCSQRLVLIIHLLQVSVLPC